MSENIVRRNVHMRLNCLFPIGPVHPYWERKKRFCPWREEERDWEDGQKKCDKKNETEI